MKLLNRFFGRPAAPLQSPFRAPAIKQHIIHVEPNTRGGLSLRWEGDDEQLGNYATVADALRVIRTNYADAVIVGPKSPAAPALSTP